MQGQFSFVLFDGEKRQVFAARDSSGSEPLYYALDEDGAVSLSNDQPPVPTADEGRVQVRGAWWGAASVQMAGVSMAGMVRCVCTQHPSAA